MKTSFVSLFFLFPIIAFSQSNYKSGYVIKNSGDTLKGYINYREWKYSPKSIKFKTSMENNQVINFKADEIKGFDINGFETYISYEGKISIDPTKFPNLPAFLDTSVVQDTVLLKQLTTGKSVTLYSYEDKIKERYFISINGAKPVELKYHQYFNSNNQIAKLDLYKIKLDSLQTVLQPDNTKLKAKIDDSKFTAYGLIEIFNLLNGNRKVKKKASARFFAGLAINSNQTEFKGINRFAGPQKAGFMPEINTGMDVFINPAIQKTIFRIELALSTTNPQFNATSDNKNYNYHYTFKQFTTSFIPQLTYNIYNSNKLKAFLNGGVSINYSFYSKNENSMTYNEIGRDYNVDPYDLEPIWISFPFRTGLVLNKRLEIYTSYTPASTISDYMLFGIESRKYSVGFKFLFKSHNARKY